MSINVTVSGSPVRIKKNKMVTTSRANNEFDKRRLIRLEQVRQQSKNIAENIRNKLRKEQSKQLSNIEEESEIKLKNWQARKLLQLQNQYQEALNEIGLGHGQANNENIDEEIFMEEQENNDKIAKVRGKEAAQKLQVEMNQKNHQKALKNQRKIITRDLENTRSKTVIQKPEFDSDVENQIPQLDPLSSASQSVESAKISKASKHQQTSNLNIQVPTSDKAAQTLISEESVNTFKLHAPIDTRISDRIKRRTLLTPDPDYCDYVRKEVSASTKPVVKVIRCICCHCPEKSDHYKEQEKHDNTLEQYRDELEKGKELNFDQSERISQEFTNIHQQDKRKNDEENGKYYESKPTDSHPSKTNTIENRKENEKNDLIKNKASQHINDFREEEKLPRKDSLKIPSKPKITLKSTGVKSISTDNKPVQYYDHPNRYSKQYIPKSANYAKIDDDSLAVSPNIVSEDEFLEKMRQRDIEAHIRGQVALEKEKIQREYQELLRKLPVLQKQERICEIGKDDEKTHMTKERYEQSERNRQNRLDNVYEELFVRNQPNRVTLPKKQDNNQQQLNLASWSVDFKQPTEDKSRTDQLNQLLNTLKAQKTSLLKEIENTLSGDNLTQITNDLTSGVDLKSKSTDYPVKKSQRKRSRQDTQVTSEIGDDDGENYARSKKSKADKKSKKPKVLILQNTSTQTTPKIKSASTSPLVTPLTNESRNVKDICLCAQKDEVCEILIKIKDDQKPEVIVNPPDPAIAVSVVGEDVTDLSKRKLNKKRDKSWQDQLVSSRSTSSTSYKDPPKFDDKMITPSDKKKSPSSNDTKSITSTSILDGSNSKKLDPRLLIYIKKLLTMSHASIDNLAVSAVSDVSTPASSVVETPNNNPMQQLLNVMKYFNLNFDDLKSQQLSENSSLHYNTKDNSEDNMNNTNTTDYADIAASCTKKISNLNALIQKVRNEKKQILESPAISSNSDSDKDMSTSYFALPPSKNDQKQNKDDDAKATSSTSSSSITSQDENKILDIDFSYAETLKRLSNEQLQDEKRKVETNEELLGRLGKLLIKKPSMDEKDNKNSPTPPLLLDIPKLPKLEAVSLCKKKKKPPPSKGLQALGPTANLPHELSTIVEADSQVSTKADSSPIKVSKTQQSQSSSDLSEQETMETMLISIGMEWAIPTLKKTREALALASNSSNSSKKDSDISLREFLSKISSTSSSHDGSSKENIGGNKRTSTPIQELHNIIGGGPIFLTDSDISSVKENSDGVIKEKFYDLADDSMSKIESSSKNKFYDLEEGSASLSKTG